nr:fimbrial protein [uncultured Ralstonia sp.]
MAQGSSVTVSGRLTASTCQWEVGESGDIGVGLDPINLGTLKLGQVAGVKTFNLSLTNCSTDTANAVFSFSGTPDLTDPLRYRNTGTASGVAVQLQSSDGATIGANDPNNQRVASRSGTRITLPLQAGYWKVVDSARAGTVGSAITFAIRYN